jgi:DNA-binding XRE family transcriptional regulator
MGFLPAATETQPCVARWLVPATDSFRYAIRKKEANNMSITIPLFIVGVLVYFGILAAVVTLVVLAIRALIKYIRSGDVRKEKDDMKRSLGEAIRQNRTRCKMTQEFVAESIGVSRQAVSKWESGKSDPSTSNLLALARLFGVPAEELLRAAE